MVEEKPLALSLGLVGLPLVLLPLLKVFRIPDDAIGPLTGAAVGILELIWLRRKQDKKSKQIRIAEARAGEVKGNPLPEVMALGVAAAGLAALVEFVLKSPAARSAEILLAQGGVVLTREGVNAYQASLNQLLRPMQFVLLLSLGIPLGRYAAHWLGRNPFPKMVGSVAVAALLVIAFNLPFAVTVAGSQAMDLGAVLRNSLPGWFVEAGLAALALLIAFRVGAGWASRTHDAFLMARLLSRTAEEDRKAVLELLSQTAGEDTTQRARPRGGEAE